MSPSGGNPGPCLVHFVFGGGSPSPMQSIRMSSPATTVEFESGRRTKNGGPEKTKIQFNNINFKNSVKFL